MNRILFESSEIAADGTAVFGGVRAEHVLNVLHGAVGQVLKTGVVDGPVGTSVVESIEPLPPDPGTGLAQGRIAVRCSHGATAVAPWVDILLAPPRPRAMKRLLPQLVQMGVGRIVLVGAEKVEKAFWGAQLLKPEVYRPLLLDGLMQCGTTALPTIQVERSFRHYMEKGRFEADFAGSGRRVLAHPYPRAQGETGGAPVPGAQGESGGAPVPGAQGESGGAPVPGAQDETGGAPVPGAQKRTLVAIGPEGGWTDAEVALLEAHGFDRLSLGPRILRTDTAAIALLARLMPV